MYEAIATITVTKNGERTNARCVTNFPVPGFEFNFTPKDGGPYPVSGVYQVKGLLEERSGVKDGKPWRFNELTGTAQPAEVTFKVK